VANARKLRLIYANKRKTDEVDAENLGGAWQASIRNSCTHSSIGVKAPRPIWPSHPLQAGPGRCSHAAREPRP
jgi:hypothetical protein